MTKIASKKPRRKPVVLTETLRKSMDEVVGMFIADDRRHLEEVVATERGTDHAYSYTMLRRYCPDHVFWALDRLAWPDSYTPRQLRNAIDKVVDMFYNGERKSYEETATLTGYDDEGNASIFGVTFDPDYADRGTELVREHSSAVQRDHIFYHLLVLAEATGIDTTDLSTSA